jgi:hypothetical protein
MSASQLAPVFETLPGEQPDGFEKPIAIGLSGGIDVD